MKFSTTSLFMLLCLLTTAFPFNLHAVEGNDFTEVVFVMDYTGHKKPSKNDLAKRFNSGIKQAVKNYWSLEMNYKFMEKKEAYKYIGANKTAIVAEIERTIESGKSETTMSFRKGKALKLLLEVRLPANAFSEADFAFALMHSQFMYRNMNKWKNPSKELPKEYGHLLKEKTLLVCEASLSKKFNQSDFAALYPHKFEVASREKIDEAILSKDENYLVLYEASDPGNVSNTTYSYWNTYQPNDGVVISRHSGGNKGLSKADVVLILKRTSKK